MLRVVAFDGGNRNSGVVVADINQEHPRMAMDVRYLACITSSGERDMKQKIQNFFTGELAQYLPATHPVLVVYEKIHHQNFGLMRINKTIRDSCQRVGLGAPSFMWPTQKYKVTSHAHNDRKVESVRTARAVLELCDPAWVVRFEALGRKHDVADALLMIEYLKRNPGMVHGAP